MFIFKSCVGTFWIKTYQGRYILGINDENLGSYYSATAAADDVFTHTTSYNPWDSLDGSVEGPTDIYEWNRY